LGTENTIQGWLLIVYVVGKGRGLDECHEDIIYTFLCPFF
jgi:hypothetical protein